MTTQRNGRVTKADLQEAVDKLLSERQPLLQEVQSLQERIVELEDRDWEWSRLDLESEFEFSRDGLGDIIRRARLMFLKNPLINRAVSVQSHYVFGQGVDISAEDEEVNDLIQQFWNDPSNQSEFTSQQAMVDKEEELAMTGNVFLVLFTDARTGRVVIRSIPVEEISDIICNPEDAREPWYYKRVWSRSTFNPLSGTHNFESRIDYYPAMGYRPRQRVPQINSSPVHWEAPVLHVKAGGTASMKFGVPEIYPALDWAKAVKEDLEDYASVKRALAMFSWKFQTTGGSRGVNAIKSTFGTTLFNGSGEGETNPPPVTGSSVITGPGSDLEPIKTAGMTPSPDEGRRMWLMVSAATGIPETILAGDADVGNLATAKSLDRPTELKMRSRQEHWKAVIEMILHFVVEKAVTANRLAGVVVPNQFSNTVTIDLGGERSAHVEVEFPSILDRNVLERVQAVVQAATLDNKVPAGTIPMETVSRLLLVALGIDDPGEEIAKLEDELPPEATMTAEARFQGTLIDLRQAIEEAKVK